jgi:hypothetical protein
MGYRQFTETYSQTIGIDILHFFFLMTMLHQGSTIIVTIWSFYFLDFADTENRCVGYNFSYEFLVNMPHYFLEKNVSI